jgi:hypothetical protein
MIKFGAGAYIKGLLHISQLSPLLYMKLTELHQISPRQITQKLGNDEL